MAGDGSAQLLALWLVRLRSITANNIMASTRHRFRVLSILLLEVLSCLVGSASPYEDGGGGGGRGRGGHGVGSYRNELIDGLLPGQQHGSVVESRVESALPHTYVRPVDLPDNFRWDRVEVDDDDEDDTALGNGGTDTEKRFFGRNATSSSTIIKDGNDANEKVPAKVVLSYITKPLNQVRWTIKSTRKEKEEAVPARFLSPPVPWFSGISPLSFDLSFRAYFA